MRERYRRCVLQARRGRHPAATLSHNIVLFALSLSLSLSRSLSPSRRRRNILETAGIMMRRDGSANKLFLFFNIPFPRPFNRVKIVNIGSLRLYVKYIRHFYRL